MKHFIASTVVAAALALVAGCQKSTQKDDASGSPTTVNMYDNYPAVRMTTVEHDGCKFIVVTTGHSESGIQFRHAPFCRGACQVPDKSNLGPR